MAAMTIGATAHLEDLREIRTVGERKMKHAGRPIRDPRHERKEKSSSLVKMLKRKGRA